MSFSIPTTPVHSDSLPFPLSPHAKPRFIPIPLLVLSAILIADCLPLSLPYTTMSSHLLLFFMDIVKQINDLQTHIELASTQMKIKFKIKKNNWVSYLQYRSLNFSQQYNCLNVGLLPCSGWEMGKIGYSISLPIIPSHPHALSHFHGGTVVLPIPMGIPWDPRDPWKFPRLTNNSLRKCVSLIGHALTIEVLLSIDSTQKYFYSQRMTNEENALHRTNLLLQHQ